MARLSPYRRQLLFSLILTVAMLRSLQVFAVVEKDLNPVPAQPGVEAPVERQGLMLDYLIYQDHVYSQSKKTELGDSANFDLGLRYQYDKDTFGRVRVITDPVENRYNNKTSQFEFLAGHRLGSWSFQVDTNVLTNDGTSGGISFGLALTSELTQIRYTGPQVDFVFYPFNFDGSVGTEFNTWDVTRLYFIDGAPTTVNATQLGTEHTTQKTIPGLELGYRFAAERARVYAGIGATTYLYPANSTFNIESAPTADRWQRKEDVGYKFGATYTVPDQLRLKIQAVGHSQTKETGALLARAASLYGIGRAGHILIENEWTAEKAGSAPYRLSRSGDWFEETSPFQPIYSDYYGNHQNWIDTTDFATSLRLGYELEGYVPYFTYKFQGSNFVFRDRESAHRLRTADESQSHGGLNRLGAGAFIYAGSFVINPEMEWFHAKNAVFGNASDERADRRLASYKNDDYQLSLVITYRLENNKIFKP